MDSNKVKQLHTLIKEVYNVAEELKIDNILYNEKYIEIILADLLAHDINKETQGADAFDGDIWIDYKTANLATPSVRKQKNPKVTFQFHWISKEKLEKCKKCIFYCAIRENAKILKVYKVPYQMIQAELEEEHFKGELRRQQIGKKKGTDAHLFLKEEVLIERGAEIVYKYE